MPTRLTAPILLAALLLLASAALAGTALHEGAKIALWHPDGWTATSAEGRLVISDPTGEVWIGAWIVEGADVKAARAALATSVAKEAQDLKVASESPLTHHGLPALTLEGTAARGGKPVKVYGHLVATTTQKVLLVLCLAPEASFQKSERSIAKIFDSIAPAK